MTNQYNSNSSDNNQTENKSYIGLEKTYVPPEDRGKLTKEEKQKSFRKLSRDISRFIKTRIK